MKRKITTYQTVTLDRAVRAVKVYNEGLDGCVENPNLDKQAHEMFADDLGLTISKVEEQVTFIGDNYGGVAGRPAAIKLAPAIARDIFVKREEYAGAANAASSVMAQVAPPNTIEILYRPFIRTLVDKNKRETKNWLVWGTKFWHHLNPPAFPIEDGRVDDFFILRTYDGPIDRYTKLLNRFRTFAQSHQEWLPHLRQADGGVDGEVDGKPVCSDNKLWDKMCYGLGDLDRTGK